MSDPLANVRRMQTAASALPGPADGKLYFYAGPNLEKKLLSWGVPPEMIRRLPNG